MDTRAQTLIQQLTALSIGLLYMSESDFPLEPFVWTQENFGDSEATPESLARFLKEPENTPIESPSPEVVWEPMTIEEEWFGEEEKEAARRFQALKAFINETLTDLKAFKVGEVEKAVYILGKTPEGDFAGIKTTVIET